MEGNVKILKPLRRPNSIYNPNLTIISPILIRVQVSKIQNIEVSR